jgi:hypothetical protein
MKISMKATIISLVFVLSTFRLFSQNVPEGYLLQYQQNFSGAKALADFRVDNPDKWGIFKSNNNFYFQSSAPDSFTRFPSNVAVLSNRIFGDFILEADVMPGNDSAAFYDVCLFLGMRYPSKYYYIQFSSLSDSMHGGIFLVKDPKWIKLTGDSSKTVKWIKNKWHKVRLERNIVRRTIRVFVDDMTIPLMDIKDYELVMGTVGFGSVSGSARFDNIKIWAPTVLSEEELKEME